MLRNPLLLVLLISLVSPYFTLGQTFRYRDYQNDSLAFGAVNKIHRDARERIWLGTDRGVFVFDGQGYSGRNTYLKSRTIHDILQWSPDSLLLLNDQGVHLAAEGAEQPDISPFFVRDSLRFPTGIFREQNGSLWIGYSGGQLINYRPDSGLEKTYYLEGGSSVSQIRFREDADGVVWVALPGKGLYRFNAEQEIWDSILDEAVRDFTQIGDRLYVLMEGSLWVCRLRNGRPGGGWQKYAVGGDIDLLYPLTDNLLLLAGKEGAYEGFLMTGKLHLDPVFGSNDPHRVEELPFKNIRALLPEWDGEILQRIWVATDRGFGLLWKGFFESVPGLPHDNVLSLNTRGGGKVRVSMGQLYEIEDADYTVSEFSEAISAISALGTEVLLGGNGGVLLYTRNGKSVGRRDLSARGGGIFHLFTDSDKNSWFCQAPSEKPLPGVARTDTLGNLYFYGREEGLDSRILVLDEGGRRELYAAGIGKQTYLYQYDRQADRFTNRSLPLPFEPSVNFEVHDLAVDGKGLVWLATTDGLLLFDEESIRRVNLGRHSKFEIRSVCVDAKGAIWAATDTDGLLYLETPGSPPVRFGEENGLPSKISAYRALDFDAAGRLWLGTAEGVVYSSMAQPEPWLSPKPIPHVAPGSKKPVFEVSRGMSRTLPVRAYAYPGDLLRYQYRKADRELSPDERDFIPWMPAEGGSIPLDTEESGTFLYEIRAQMGEGHFWSEATHFPVQVRNPWYRRGTFYAVLALLGISGLWLGWKRSLNRRLSGLQRELDQKSSTLHRQSDQLRAQRKSAQATQTHLYLLERLVRSLPAKMRWADVWPVFRRVIALPLDIERIEIYMRSGNDLVSRAIIKGDEIPRHRRQPFDEKINLPSYAVSHRRVLHITDLTDKAQWPVARESEKEGSLLLIPFEQGGSGMIFCSYSPRPQAYGEDDLLILKLFVSILSRSLTDAFV